MNIDWDRMTPCTITPRTETNPDADGGATKIDGTPFASRVFRERQTRAEVGDGATNVSVEQWVAHFPATDDLQDLYGVTIAGRDYEVIGEPGPAENPFGGTVDFQTATIQRTA